MNNSKIFLTARWRHLVMLNYRIDADVLAPYVPRGTELDLFQGTPFVSMVGFLFLDTRVLGIPVPLHRHFEEVNLRFYVRREAADGLRRGVVFIKEIVPRWAVTMVARTVYHENYITLPMRHEIALLNGQPRPESSARYQWLVGGRWNCLQIHTNVRPAPAAAGSEQEFITEHYWGYCQRRDGGTMEYRVAHPRWHVSPARQARLDCDAAALYGPRFAAALDRPANSAFLVDGSDVAVYRGRRLS